MELIARKLEIKSETDSNDILYINDTKGVRLLVKLIKLSILHFSAKSNKISSKTYANATRSGQLHPV